jgi:hypothetical protein
MKHPRAGETWMNKSCTRVAHDWSWTRRGSEKHTETLRVSARGSAATQCVDAVHNGKRTKIVHLLQYICVDPTPGLESGVDQYFRTTATYIIIATTTVTTMTVLEQALSSTTAIKRTSEVQKGPQVKGVAKMNPYATRHRGVLTLYKEVNLYDLRSVATTPTSLPDTIRSSRSAIPVMHAQKIATKRLKRRMDGSGMLNLEVDFLATQENNDRKNSGSATTQQLSYIFSIPQHWSPKIFLAAVNKSAMEHNVLSIDTVMSRNGTYNSINEIHLYHGREVDFVCRSLRRSAAYIDVSGGGVADV